MTTPAQPRRLTVTVEASDPSGHLSLRAFIDLLDSLKAALLEFQRDAVARVGHAVQVEYRVVKVTHNSPLTLQLEEETTTARGKDKGKAAPPANVPPALIDGFKRVGQKGFVPRHDDVGVIQAVEELLEHVGDTVRSITLQSKNERIALSSRYKKRLEDWLGPDEHILGVVQGRLDVVDLHRKRRCYIYPVIGPKRIKCDFPEHLEQAVLDAMRGRVRVYGRLSYRAWSPFPHQVAVESIECLPPDDDLPMFGDLAGLYEGADLTEEDFATWPDDE